MACATLLHLFMASMVLVYYFILASLPSTLSWKIQHQPKLKAKATISQAYLIHLLKAPQITLNRAAQRKIKAQMVINDESLANLKWRNWPDSLTHLKK